MRVRVVLCVLLFGCTYETNYYAAPCGDGGVSDMAGYVDHFGEWHEEDVNQGIFRGDSKLQGNADLILAPAPALIVTPAVPARFPMIRESQATMAQAATLIDLATRDNQPHVVTASLGGLVQPVEYQVGPFTEVVALLNLGIGGAAYYAEVDYVENMQFSLAVNRLQLLAVFRTVFGGAIAPPPGQTIPPYSVGASVASDVVAHGRQPQRTLTHAGTVVAPALAVAPGGGDGVWVIPPFAKSFRVVAQPENSQMMIYLATVALGNQIAHYPVVAPALQDYPIPSTAHYVYVENTSLVNTVRSYSLIFELAL